MSFRQRIALASAAAVAVAILLASALVYMLTSEQLHHQVDRQLANRALYLRYVPRTSGGTRQALLNLLKGESQAARTGGTSPLSGLPPRPNQVRGYQQLVDSNGDILFTSSSNVTLPVDTRTVELAEGRGHSFYRDANVADIHLRILTEQIASGHAIQVAQPLTEVDSLQSRLRLILSLLDIGGIALAALLGRLVAGAAVQPLKRLTQATEHVTLTRDLSRRISSTGGDEIGRLASSFNAMLDALERSMKALDASVGAQRQLVADASHELRTPVTSLRTNIELLQQQGDAIDAPTRGVLLAESVEQIEDLIGLINDLIDLARGEEPATDVEELRLDLLVSEVVERKRRSAAGAMTPPIHVELEPAIVAGVPARLERAVGNLLDNAIKYSPAGEPVEIALHGDELTVRDHGPGISAEDLPYVFDRFYRGAEARGRPGSGLGLAIVRQVAAQQGGSVTVEAATGGGTLIRLRLPGTEPVPASADGEPTATATAAPAARQPA